MQHQLNLLEWRDPTPPPMETASIKPWTPSDRDRLVSMYLDGDMPDVAAIAAALGRSYSNVASMASRTGLSFTRRGENAKLRRCMRQCGRDFWSESFSNRICPSCKRSKEYLECA
jgi:hypothetical protein